MLKLKNNNTKLSLKLYWNKKMRLFLQLNSIKNRDKVILKFYENRLNYREFFKSRIFLDIWNLKYRFHTLKKKILLSVKNKKIMHRWSLLLDLDSSSNRDPYGIMKRQLLLNKQKLEILNNYYLYSVRKRRLYTYHYAKGVKLLNEKKQKLLEKTVLLNSKSKTQPWIYDYLTKFNKNPDLNLLWYLSKRKFFTRRFGGKQYRIYRRIMRRFLKKPRRRFSKRLEWKRHYVRDLLLDTKTGNFFNYRKHNWLYLKNRVYTKYQRFLIFCDNYFYNLRQWKHAVSPSLGNRLRTKYYNLYYYNINPKHLWWDYNYKQKNQKNFLFNLKYVYPKYYQQTFLSNPIINYKRFIHNSRKQLNAVYFDEYEPFRKHLKRKVFSATIDVQDFKQKKRYKKWHRRFRRSFIRYWDYGLVKKQDVKSLYLTKRMNSHRLRSKYYHGYDWYTTPHNERLYTYILNDFIEYRGDITESPYSWYYREYFNNDSWNFWTFSEVWSDNVINFNSSINIDAKWFLMDTDEFVDDSCYNSLASYWWRPITTVDYGDRDIDTSLYSLDSYKFTLYNNMLYAKHKYNIYPFVQTFFFKDILAPTDYIVSNYLISYRNRKIYNNYFKLPINKNAYSILNTNLLQYNVWGFFLTTQDTRKLWYFDVDEGVSISLSHPLNNILFPQTADELIPSLNNAAERIKQITFSDIQNNLVINSQLKNQQNLWNILKLRRHVQLVADTHVKQEVNPSSFLLDRRSSMLSEDFVRENALDEYILPYQSMYRRKFRPNMTLYRFMQHLRRYPSSYRPYQDAMDAFQLGFQDPATPIMEGIIDFHNDITFVLIVVLFFVFWLLYITIRSFMVFLEKDDKTFPIPSKLYSSHNFHWWLPNNKTHNTLIEIIWTLTPSFILILIALPSFALLYSMDEIINPLVTFKAIGNQWYWSYQYVYMQK